MNEMRKEEKNRKNADRGKQNQYEPQLSSLKIMEWGSRSKISSLFQTK